MTEAEILAVLERVALLRLVADENEQDTIALYDSKDPGRADRIIAELRKFADELESSVIRKA